MAYRRSYYRKGYFRRTKNGGLCWVSPTEVSGYSYTPGIPHFTAGSIPHFTGSIPHIIFNDGEHDISNPVGSNFDENTFIKIVELFRKLDSNERKYCLDLLDTIDSQLDLDTTNKIALDAQQKSNTEDDDSYKYTLLDDGTISIDEFIGFDVSEITIPHLLNGQYVSRIGNSAFKRCASIETITIEEGIISIGNNTFEDCSKLTQINMPSTLIKIGDYAFSRTNIRKLTFPENVVEIGEYACWSCKNLHTVHLPNQLRKINNGLFIFCSKLSQVNIPPQITEIGCSAFSGTNLFGYIELPESLVRIESFAFDFSTNIGSRELTVYVPKSVSFIGIQSFINNCFVRTTLLCKSGSYALKYARENSIPYAPANK